MDNSAQISYWNGPAGAKWVREADRLDAMLEPFAALLIAAASFTPGDTVIDIGCGAGRLSLAAAATGASVTGVDISESLIALAKHRASGKSGLRAAFRVADASELQVQEAISVAISRFGVMFFAEPETAFRNIRGWMQSGGRLVFACWQPLARNDWAMLPVKVALPFLKEVPTPSPPGTPGPFAFGDEAYLRSILDTSDWSNISITPWVGEIQLPGSGASETADFMLDIGPLGRAIADQQVDPLPIRAALVEEIARHSDSNGRTHLSAAVWIVEARA